MNPDEGRRTREVFATEGSAGSSERRSDGG